MEKLISVIVPIYNTEQYLPECIESIISQTYKYLQIILVNDGSTDNSLKICRHYEKVDKRIVVIDKENEGVVLAREAGLRIAAGDYIAFVDSDDWIDCTMYAALLEKLIATNADVITSSYYDEKDPCFREGKYPKSGVYQSGMAENKLYENLFYDNGNGIVAGHWDKIYKKDLIKKFHGKVDHRVCYGEDAMCTYPLILNADKVCVTDHCFYHYRKRDGSASRKMMPDYYVQMMLLYDYLHTECYNHYCRETLISQLKEYMIGIFMHGLLCTVGVKCSRKYLFPYKLVPYGSKIALYGAGIVGSSYHDEIKGNHYCEIVCWVDKNADEFSNKNTNIMSVEQIFKVEFDYLLIAIKNATIVEGVKRYLCNKGIDKEKILWLKPETADNIWMVY